MSLLVHSGDQLRFWMHQLSESLIFALGLFFVIQLINTLLVERQTQQQLFVAHEQLRHYALQVEDLAAVQERNRIAREIHDSLGHVLTALNVQLQTATKLWPIDTTKAATFLIQARRLGETAMQEVRQSVHALRADAMTTPPLDEAIVALVDNFRQGTGIVVTIQMNLDQTLPPAIVQAVYRIVQESLTNIYKHAQATAVQIKLQTTSKEIYLSVVDNGQGFQTDSCSAGFGLQGMQERVAALKGDFQLETAPGKGCSIQVQIPVLDAQLHQQDQSQQDQSQRNQSQ